MTAVTLAAALAWMRESIGKFYNPDNAHGYQCKDWADAFCIFLFGGWVDTIRPGNGADVFDNANPEFFIKVRNDPNRPDQLPPPGSIVSIAGSRAVPEGHVAGVLGADAGGMDVVQMNGYTQQAAHTARLPYDGLIGWLIPKYAVINTTQQEDEVTKDELKEAIREEIALAVMPGETGQRNAGPLYQLAEDLKWLRSTFTTGEAGKRQAGEALRLILEAAAK
jgi:hypothetical protein